MESWFNHQSSNTDQNRKRLWYNDSEDNCTASFKRLRVTQSSSSEECSSNPPPLQTSPIAAMNASIPFTQPSQPTAAQPAGQHTCSSLEEQQHRQQPIGNVNNYAQVNNYLGSLHQQRKQRQIRQHNQQYLHQHFHGTTSCNRSTSTSSCSSDSTATSSSSIPYRGSNNSGSGCSNETLCTSNTSASFSNSLHHVDGHHHQNLAAIAAQQRRYNSIHHNNLSSGSAHYPRQRNQFNITTGSMQAKLKVHLPSDSKLM